MVKKEFKVVQSTVSIPVELLHGNIKNPRKIDDKNRRRLERDIKKDEWYLKYRPLLAYIEPKTNRYIVYAGNMRLLIAQGLGLEEIPVNIDTDVVQDGKLNEKLLNERLFRDNESYGETDKELLNKYFDRDELLAMDLWHLTKDVLMYMEDPNKAEFNKIDNSNCEYAIVPKFWEKYTAFVIVCENITDETWFRQNFWLDKMKCYKTQRIAPTQVITFSQFYAQWLKISNQSQ